MTIIKSSFLSLCVLFFALTNTFPTQAQVKVARIFGGGMVLQRDHEVPVWGWAEKGEKITISINGKKYSASPDKTGKWMVNLPAMKAGGPYEMVISGKKESTTLKDIYIGDVWVCSGQSNMEWSVAASAHAESEIAAANDGKIRHFKVPLSSAVLPEETLAGGEWKVANPENVGEFTAVGYYFAKNLRHHHPDIPIGLLNSSWGGSRLEPWMSAESLGLENPQEHIGSIKKKYDDEAEQRKQALMKKVGNVPEKDPGLVDGKAIWAAPDLDDSGWSEMAAPGLWETTGYDGLDGIVWFRKVITLSEEEANQNIQLGLGRIDDSDQTWVNGKKVGETIQQYNQARLYEVDKSLLKPGKNIIAVRVEDTGGGGGFHGEKDLMYVKTSKGTQMLNGTWKFKIGEFRVSSASHDNHIPTLLYNKMIYPILDFPIKGVIWYQGESNADPQSAYPYRKLFATMINDWREKWNVGSFPFLFVQLANFMAPDEQPAESSWAVLRESQSATLSVPNTAQAVIIDIGEANDIHPKNKQDVGLRLSLAARKLAYGDDVIYSGPTYKNHEIKDGKVVVSFENTGSGLWIKDKYGYVNGFAIAGEDKKFVWAKAKREGDKIVVWSEGIKNPVAVRYGWGNNPDDLNVYNKEGLPASPFRTDNW